MSIKQNIQVRDARDRLSELLELGQPFPLRDLPVPIEGLTVPFNQAAKIPVEWSQLGVLYQLHDPRENLVTRSTTEGDIPVQAEGNGEVIYLVTPPIENDISYKILATKIDSGKKAYLHTLATVKVGLDITLTALIRNHLALDVNADHLLNTDPRLCSYGDTLEVEMPVSQEGVDYRLVHFVGSGAQMQEVVLTESDVRGTGELIVLNSKPVYKDTVVRIRAIKTFDESEGRATQSDLLTIELPIAVKANRNVNVSVSVPIVEYGKQTAVHIADSQASVQYRVFAHRIHDPEIIHDPAPDAEVLRIKLPQEPEVQVRRPIIPESWGEVTQFVALSLIVTPVQNDRTVKDGFTAVTEYFAGNGKELVIPLDNFTEDSVLLVEAMNTHRLTKTTTVPISTWLSQAMLALSRPNPDPELSLVVAMQGDKSDGSLQVEAGQPGVFYFFRTVANGDELPLPAYIHQRDDGDDTINKGLDQLEVGIDFVVAADPSSEVIVAQPQVNMRPPEPPILETGPLAAGATLYARAMKAQTRIEADLSKTAAITALPQVQLAQAGVTVGGTASITIVASLAGDSYQLLLKGKPVNEPVSGNGGDLTIKTDVISADSTFQLRASQPADSGIPVYRVMNLLVLLKPDSKLAVSALATTVAQNSSTTILVKSSQEKVVYQLLVGGKEIGDAVIGTGGDINIPTGPLTADTTFVVRAARQADTSVSIELEQQVTVTIQPVAQ